MGVLVVTRASCIRSSQNDDHLYEAYDAGDDASNPEQERTIDNDHCDSFHNVNVPYLFSCRTVILMKFEKACRSELDSNEHHRLLKNPVRSGCISCGNQEPGTV